MIRNSVILFGHSRTINCQVLYNFKTRSQTIKRYSGGTLEDYKKNNRARTNRKNGQARGDCRCGPVALFRCSFLCDRRCDACRWRAVSALTAHPILLRMLNKADVLCSWRFCQFDGCWTPYRLNCSWKKSLASVDLTIPPRDYPSITQLN